VSIADIGETGIGDVHFTILKDLTL